MAKNIRVTVMLSGCDYLDGARLGDVFIGIERCVAQVLKRI